MTHRPTDSAPNRKSSSRLATSSSLAAAGVLLAGVAAGCSPTQQSSRPVAPIATVPDSGGGFAQPPDDGALPEQPAPKPVVRTCPTDPYPDKDQPKFIGARLEMSIDQPLLTKGDVTTIRLRNVDDHDYCQWHPGASNGCGGFKTGLILTHTDGTVYKADYISFRQLCTAVMLPPQWIAIGSGKEVTVGLNTNQRFFRYAPPSLSGVMPKEPPAELLKPGSYTVRLTGYGSAPSATLVLSA